MPEAPLDRPAVCAAERELSVVTGGGGGAAVGAQYITAATDATLTNERVLTSTPTINSDFTDAGSSQGQRALAVFRRRRMRTERLRRSLAPTSSTIVRLPTPGRR